MRSIRTYVVIEQTEIGLVVYCRNDEDAWTAMQVTDGATLPLPEIGIEIPVAEFYEGEDFGDRPNTIG